MNTIRKHLSDVKGGKFAKYCYPAKIYSIVLSYVIGDRLDSIASGPAYPDSSTVEEALVKRAVIVFDNVVRWLDNGPQNVINYNMKWLSQFCDCIKDKHDLYLVSAD